MEEDVFLAWLRDLEARHLSDLSFPEVRRAVQALSSLYVEGRVGSGFGAAFASAGKRAAYALFYGPLHFLAVREIVRAAGTGQPPVSRIVDLGCGTGTASAAWALESGGGVPIEGIDRSGWALEEARRAWRCLGVRGRGIRGAIEKAHLPGAKSAIILAWTANELARPARERVLDALLDAASRGARVLVVEPVSRRAVPWWEEWAAAFVRGGGIEDRWRFPVRLPERLRLLDRASGLDHRELTARTLRIGWRG